MNIYRNIHNGGCVCACACVHVYTLIRACIQTLTCTRKISNRKTVNERCTVFRCVHFMRNEKGKQNLYTHLSFNHLEIRNRKTIKHRLPFF